MNTNNRTIDPISKDWHAEPKERIPLNDVIPGDLIWNFGELFQVLKIQCQCRQSPSGRISMTFEGKCLTKDLGGASIHGGWSTERRAIIRRNHTI